MQRSIAFLLIVFLLPAYATSAGAARLHEYSAEALKLDNNRLYLWVETSVDINTDFSLEIESKRHESFIVPISGVLDKVVVSDTLPGRLLKGLEDFDNFTIKVFLNTDKISDSLVIALPQSLRELQLDTLWIRNHSLPVDYRFRYYDKLQEVEIAAQLGQIDLLIMPAPDLPAERVLAECPFELEWYLLGKDIDDDLLATAFTYCLKGEFAADSSEVLSVIIEQEHFRGIFPHNIEFATGLFNQIRPKERNLNCYVENVEMYSNIGQVLNEHLSNCSGGKLLLTGNERAAASLVFIPINPEVARDNCRHRFVSEVILPIHRNHPLWKNAALDSCLMNMSDTLVNCHELLSRAVSESARIIPLGRTGLAIRKFDHVRYLEDHDITVKLSNFYTVKK